MPEINVPRSILTLFPTRLSPPSISLQVFIDHYDSSPLLFPTTCANPFPIIRADDRSPAPLP